MTVRRRNRAVAAAVIVVAGIVLVALTRGGSYETTAIFDQVNGLVTGGDVRAGGERVGHVTGIALGADGRPHVTMQIDDGFRLRSGARADIRFTSVAGEINRYVDLTSGRGAPLPHGATIAASQTDQPVEIDQVLSTLDPATRRDVRGLLAQMDLATRHRGGVIAAALQHSAGALEQLTAVVRQVRGDGDTLRNLIRDAHATLAPLARDSRSLGTTVDELAATLQTTARRQRELGAITQRLAPGLRAPTDALRTTDSAIPQLRALVADLRPAVAALPGFAADLRPALAAARPALASARRLATEAPPQLPGIAQLARQAAPALTRLAPVLQHADPMLDQLRTRLPDFFAFLSGWADFGSNYDANGHLARVGLVFSPAPVTPIGPSDSTAGQLRAPFLRTPGVLEGEPWTTFEQSFMSGGTR